ncbi:helix-turn-helix domain-containing protein [Streptomyces collinus]|uniref:helix-turn-helix domain-containing protein n=1 Tax=Streptomyces collinus TaxID=42684 RepID=UPI003682096B
MSSTLFVGSVGAVALAVGVCLGALQSFVCGWFLRSSFVEAAVAEPRRVRTIELFEQGRPNTEIAEMVGVHAESVRRWRRAWEIGGAQALRRWSAPVAAAAAACTRRRPKLDDG